MACAVALVPADVEALTALRTVLLSRRKRGRGRPRLLGWVEGWVEGLADGEREEVRRVSAGEGRVVLRDRRRLRQERMGMGMGMGMGRGGDEGRGGGSGGQLVGGRGERRQESEDDGWEEEVVEAYRDEATADESGGETGVQGGSEDFESRNGDDGWASRVDATDQGGDAERRAEEYRMLLSPRPDAGTPVSIREAYATAGGKLGILARWSPVNTKRKR